MAALRAQIEARLQESEDYRALKALDKALADLGHASKEQVGSPLIRQPRRVSDGLSHADAAEKVMDQIGEPIPIADLVSRVREMGAHVGGQDPNINLSSTLSKDPRFRSVRYQGRKAWWLAGRAYPNEDAVDRSRDLLEAQDPPSEAELARNVLT
jgi:hypothetical protein